MQNLLFDSGQEAVSNLAQAIVVGLKDGVNPGGISAVVFFLVILFWIIRHERLFFASGLSFLLGVLFSILAQILGFFDPILRLKEYDVFLDVVYFLMSLSAIAIGTLFLRDWFLATKDGHPGRALIRFPFLGRIFTKEEAKTLARRITKKEKLFITAFFPWGCILALIIAAWAPDKSIGIMQYQLATHGKVVAASISFLLYALANMVILWSLWAGGCYVLRSEKVRAQWRRWITTAQIIFAAVFMSYGLVMIYRYYYLVGNI